MISRVSTLQLKFTIAELDKSYNTTRSCFINGILGIYAGADTGARHSLMYQYQGRHGDCPYAIYETGF